MRKLASIKRIDAIDPIIGADLIECATVGGWKVVVKKNEFQPGDFGIYFEIDSWIPFDLAPHLSRGSEQRRPGRATPHSKAQRPGFSRAAFVGVHSWRQQNTIRV